MTAPRFAFLALAGHPYGGHMLSCLLARDLAPALVIEEASPVAEEERAKFLARIAGHPGPPTLQDQAEEHGLERLVLPDHRDPRVVQALEPMDLDLVVLGGTRILRGPLLSLPRDGVLNAHPGLLPECRGSASPAWSVLHDLPIGATAHFCDEGIDTGDLLLRRELPVRRGATYEDLCFGTLVLAGELMAEVVAAWGTPRWADLRHPQGASEHPTFKNAPPEVLQAVRDKLAQEAYAHYTD